jgi:hypothetical protein
MMNRSLRDLANSLKKDGKIVVSKSIGGSVEIVRKYGITMLVKTTVGVDGRISQTVCEM